MHDRFGLQTLLSPLPDGVGADPREDGAGVSGFLAVKDARAAARLAERDALASADPDVDPLRAGARAWTKVAEDGAALLANQAKDLQVAAWLCEAWLRTDGFSGLAAGFALMSGLIEAFWDEGLHPQEDEEGAETRVSPLFGLFGRGDTGTLLQPIKLLPLSDDGATPVALWTVENAQAQSTRHDDPDVREGLVARRQERIAALDDAVAKASPAFAADIINAITSALAELDRLMSAIDARTSFGRFGTQVSRPLEDILGILRAAHGNGDQPEQVSDEADPQEELDEFASVIPASAGTVTENIPKAANKSVMTRETALATLLEVAAFFERNEPQSLVALSLRDIVRRADLPLEMLLRELLPEDEQRMLFLMRAGIRVSGLDADGSVY